MMLTAADLVQCCTTAMANISCVCVQAAGAALAKLAKAEKVASAGLALLAPLGDVPTAAAKLTTGGGLQTCEGANLPRLGCCANVLDAAYHRQQAASCRP
jgi:hypothetical protein